LFLFLCNHKNIYQSEKSLLKNTINDHKFSGNNNNFNLVFICLTNIFDTYLKIIKNKYNKNGER